MDVKERPLYTLDKGVMFLPEKRCLMTHDGISVELSENSYRFLLQLLNGETDKQKIINEVWAEQKGSVSESSYYGQLYLLRRSFNEVGLSHSLIKTIPRKGVKYTGEVIKGTLVEGEHPLPFPVQEKSVTEVRFEGPGDEEKAAAKRGSSIRGKPEWYNSKSWNIFVFVLSVLAVCWLVTLTMAILFFWKV
ncbi:transcriptional regulator [Scandinavium sp.]|uniref:winged helix-turn-helix domain-containing protein n=1 Tax=Scandinavium sp. TaxID=2830653 RepID=UPI00289A4464|nr:transcriptional regulator [Scandinavium sp.]